MATKRSDKAKNIDKVAAALVKNPLATEKELASDAGIGMGTAHRAKKEVERTGESMKDSRIVALTDRDMELQELIQARKFKKLIDEPDKISDGDLNQWDRHSMARLTTLRGSVTDDEGGLKKVDPKIVAGLSEEEVNDKLKEMLGA